MTNIGLDIGTGFVKCVSDHGRFKFPSLYARRINGNWNDTITEAIGDKAACMLKTGGTTAISPIRKGRPEKRYQKQVELLIQEAINRVCQSRDPIPDTSKTKIVVGLPYEAAHYKNSMIRMINGIPGVEECSVVAQAVGTLVSMDRNSGMAVSIGQGTSEIILIEDNKIIDGQSMEWASEFITRKIGRFAHLDSRQLHSHKDICTKYAKGLAENLAEGILEMAETHGYAKEIIVSGGGILIPRVRQELTGRLKGFEIVVPDDPVMSNALGLYRLAC